MVDRMTPGLGRSIIVLVHEHVTGGGMAGRDLPESWAREGSAIRRAVASDFAAVPGVLVVATIDPRFSEEASLEVSLRVVGEGNTIGSLAAEVDYTVLIAPEAENLLWRSTRMIEEAGGQVLGSGRSAINLTSDKERLARFFQEHGIPTPPTWMVDSPFTSLPVEWSGPIVIKPRWGAGGMDASVVRDRRIPDWVSPERPAIAQPYLPGRPMSASFLVDVEGQPTLLAVGSQRIEVSQDGQIGYRGGTILPMEPCPREVGAALVALSACLPTPGLRGFVGVDFLLDDAGAATLIEVNARPTTSYVGLVRVFPAGTIAGAWLAAVEGGLAAAGWPERIQKVRRDPSVTFLADGSILTDEERLRS